MYTEVFSDSVSALVWGQQHEVDALEDYKLTLESGSTLRDAGIYIDNCGFLGASDSVVDHSGNIVRIVEVKCPCKAREKTLEEMYNDKSFCCSLTDGAPTLKQDHEYFYQIQGQMAVTGTHTCDFAVWTTFDFVVLTV